MLQGCLEIRQRVKRNLKANCEVFKVYLERNLSPRPVPPVNKEELLTKGEELWKEIEVLRERRHILESKLNKLQGEVALGQDLHASLTKTLYSLRVGAQAFEDPSIHSLFPTLASLVSKRNELGQLVARVQGDPRLKLVLPHFL